MRADNATVKIGIVLAVLVLAGFSHPGASFAAPLPATASLESMSLEDLMNIPVYAASRFEQKSSEAPSSVTVVTSREIRKSGWRTLADLLRTVRGFHVSYDRSYDWVGVRGFLPPGDSNTKILTLVDGHRLNDDVYNQAYMGEDFLLDLDLVDRVEIVRGPGSSLYGSNAFFAVINVITRRGESVKGVEASLEGEHPKGLRGRLTAGNRLANGVEYLLSASALGRRGEDLFFPEFNDPATNNGVAQGLDGVRNRRFFGSASLGAFALTGGYVRRDKDIPTSSFGSVFPDPTAWYRDESYFAEARYEKEHRGTSVQARLFWDWYKFDSKGTLEDNTVNPILPFRFLLRDKAEAQSWGAEAKFTRTLLERHTATAGAEYRGIYRIRQTDFVEEPFTSYLDTNRNGYIWALYLQDEVRITKGLLFNVGVRHDRYKTFGGTTNPRAALIWAPQETTALKLLYGQAFRAPTPFELYWNDGDLTQKASPDLKPETIRTLEVVWEQGLGKNLRSVVAVYENRIKDLIGVVTDPADGLDVSRNLGEAKGRGVEVELAGKWDSGFEGRVSGTLQRSEDSVTGERLPNSPARTVQANGIFPLYPGKIFAGIEGQYTAPREPALPAHSTMTCGHTVVNLTLYARELVKGVNASATVYNLLDRSYSDLGGPEHTQELIPQDGRSFRVKVTAAF